MRVDLAFVFVDKDKLATIFIRKLVNVFLILLKAIIDHKKFKKPMTDPIELQDPNIFIT